MPFTPYHFGLGALAKAAAPKHFSFQAFAASQVLMDIEPLINLVFGLRPLHGWTHTYWGALGIALSSAPLLETMGARAPSPSYNRLREECVSGRQLSLRDPVPCLAGFTVPSGDVEAHAIHAETA